MEMSNTRMKIKLFSLPLDLEKSQKAVYGTASRPEMAGFCAGKSQRKMALSLRK
jgi:hypothetical protein